MDNEQFHLTPREWEILALIAQGKSNREMADSLSITENTVETHLSHLTQKLGGTRRWWASYFLQHLAQPPGES